MRINADGQVTIPADIREKAGLLPDTEISIELDGDGVRIGKQRAVQEVDRGARAVAALRGKGDVNLDLTTDEIMTLMRGS